MWSTLRLCLAGLGFDEGWVFLFGGFADFCNGVWVVAEFGVGFGGFDGDEVLELSDWEAALHVVAFFKSVVTLF